MLYKWKCPIGHCVNSSMVQKRHLGDTDMEVIRVLVIDEATFTVTYFSCSIVQTEELKIAVFDWQSGISAEMTKYHQLVCAVCVIQFSFSIQLFKLVFSVFVPASSIRW